jgi:hypothetical protein
VWHKRGPLGTGKRLTDADLDAIAADLNAYRDKREAKGQ